MRSLLALLIFTVISSAGYTQWKKISAYTPDLNEAFEDVCFIDGKEGYLTFYGSFRFTADSGKTYVNRTVSVPQFPLGLYMFNGAAVVNSTTVLLYGMEGATPFILRSNDKGVTWSTVYTAVISSPSYLGDGITHLVMLNSTTGYATRRGYTLITNDGGVSWTQRSTFNTTEFTGLSAKASTVWASGNDMSAYRITTTGSSRQTNLQGTVNTVAVAGTDKIYAHTTDGIYYTNNNGTSWLKKTPAGKTALYPEDWYFINDSTGYLISNDRIYFTRNYAVTWELMAADYPLQGSSESIDHFFFQDDQLAFAAGNGPVLYKTANGGGIPYPEALFTVNKSTISTDSMVYLNNYSFAGYTQSWIKNGAVISSAYNASYKSNRSKKDTILLIVTNATGTDTATEYVETRVPDYNCNAAFNLILDTSTIKLYPVNNLHDYRLHTWNMGNSVVLQDSTPIYQYPARGQYTITHTISDPISGCSNTTTRSVNVTKLTNCDGLLAMSHTIDAFKNDDVYLMGNLYDSYIPFTNSLNPSRLQWYYGDGDSSALVQYNHSHIYPANGAYHLRLELSYNNNTCNKTFYDTIIIAMDSCSANFIRTNGTTNGEVFDWLGRPQNGSATKLHRWILDDKDTVTSGTSYKTRIDYVRQYSWWSTCALGNNPYAYYYIHNMDSAIRKVKHIVSDASTGCYTADSTMIELQYGYSGASSPKSFNIWQDYNNPYYFHFQLNISSTSQCFTVEGTNGSSGSTLGQFIKNFNRHGEYGVNGTNAYDGNQVYRRRVVVDGEMRYFTGTPNNEVVGKIFIDHNGNGVYDSGDSLYKLPVKITGNNGTTTAVVFGENGRYRYTIPKSTANVSTTLTLQKPYYSVSPTTKIHSFANVQGKSDTADFALTPLAVQDVAVRIISITPARPGFTSKYKLTITNNAPLPLVNVPVRFIKDGRMLITATSQTPASTTGDTTIYSITQLLEGETKVINISTTLLPPPALNFGDTLVMQVDCSIAFDADLSDNQMKLKQLVTGSYDPNDKTENIGGKLLPSEVTSGRWIYYLVRFQNTGNDTAFNVIVRDTLHNNLQAGTFEMLEASHPYKLTIQNGNDIKWLFKQILLPDSNRNEPGSHGYVLYRVKPKSLMVTGDSIVNRASIYFDFNTPVLTNKALTRVTNAVGVLPVRLISLTTKQVNSNYIEVNWSTATEVNNKGFIIERSTDGILFQPIGSVEATSGPGIKHYLFNDKYVNTHSRYYYRLKIVSTDGSITYSNTVAECICFDEQRVSVVPNPGKEVFNVRISGLTGVANMGVYNLQGRLVYSRTVNPVNNSINEILNLSTLAPGTYILKVFDQTNQFMIRLVKM